MSEKEFRKAKTKSQFKSSSLFSRDESLFEEGIESSLGSRRLLDEKSKALESLCYLEDLEMQSEFGESELSSEFNSSNFPSSSNFSLAPTEVILSTSRVGINFLPSWT